MESISETISKTKANVVINLEGDTTVIQWQCSKPNNGNIQYSKTVQLLVENSYLDQYT